MAERARRRGVGTQGRLRRAWPVLVPVMLLLGLLAGVYAYFSQPGRMPLRVIEITGEFTYLEQSDIEQRVAGAIDGGFLNLDLQRMREDVLAMPWVDQVSVRRVWPDTLRMHVTEQVPLAYWNHDALVNLEGEVFRPASLPVLSMLPHLYGRDRDARRVVEFYLQLHARLLNGELRVARLELNPRDEWQLTFRNGLELMLGREAVARRQQVFLEIYPQLLAFMHRQPQRIDMRYEHGFAVRWREKTGDS